GLNDGNHVRGVTIGIDPATGNTAMPNFSIPFLQSSFDAATIPALTNLGATTQGGANFGIAFLNDIDVFLLLDAVQGDRRSNTLQAPKVTLFNGQFAFVFIGRSVPFVTDVTPVVSAGSVAFDPTIQTIPEGTTLLVQAVISADRRYVRLNLAPQILEIDNVD